MHTSNDPIGFFSRWGRFFVFWVGQREPENVEGKNRDWLREWDIYFGSKNRPVRVIPKTYRFLFFARQGNAENVWVQKMIMFLGAVRVGAY